MKKVFVLVIAIAMLFAFTACGGRAAAPPAGGSPTAPGGSPTTPTTPGGSPTTPAKGEVAYKTTYSNARVWTDSIGSKWVQVIVEIENTGTVPLYLSSGSVDLEDSSGTLVKSLSLVSAFPDVIDPGEKGYYYDETTIDNEDVTGLVVVPRPDVRKAKVDNIKFNVSEFSLSDDKYFGIHMIGRVENTSDEEAGMTYVGAVLFDSNDTPIGLLYTIVSGKLEPGDKVGFEGSALTLPRDIKADTVARYEVFAYPSQMQFDF
ncbi:MAG: FxLYD domain-containing protein [Clostridiales bacterium]|nr:FxLYD domain-containing protein [Clostridiales bacterium]